MKHIALFIFLIGIHGVAHSKISLKEKIKNVLPEVIRISDPSHFISIENISRTFELRTISRKTYSLSLTVDGIKTICDVDDLNESNSYFISGCRDQMGRDVFINHSKSWITLSKNLFADHPELDHNEFNLVQIMSKNLSKQKIKNRYFNENNHLETKNGYNIPLLEVYFEENEIYVLDDLSYSFWIENCLEDKFDLKIYLSADNENIEGFYHYYYERKYDSCEDVIKSLESDEFEIIFFPELKLFQMREPSLI